ncbi:MAG TPA: helix-turn-helix domain-containing protein [Planctomycetota bacterium]|nr:helix-turn-helix domain-containing protein [Planctomycetota bacterium]
MPPRQDPEDLERAKGFVEGTNLPVEVIASVVGFRSYAYFREVFRARYGALPGDYRTQFRREHPMPAGLPETAQITFDAPPPDDAPEEPPVGPGPRAR